MILDRRSTTPTWLPKWIVSTSGNGTTNKHQTRFPDGLWKEMRLYRVEARSSRAPETGQSIPRPLAPHLPGHTFKSRCQQISQSAGHASVLLSLAGDSPVNGRYWRTTQYSSPSFGQPLFALRSLSKWWLKSRFPPKSVSSAFLALQLQHCSLTSSGATSLELSHSAFTGVSFSISFSPLVCGLLMGSSVH